MTEIEFDEWLTHHCNRFAGLDRKIFGDDRNDGDPTIARDFFHHLGSFEKSELMAATLHLMALEDQPFPEQHLGKIKAFCKTNRFEKHKKDPQPYRKEETYRCGQCRDRGSIYVFHPIAYRPIFEDRFDRKRHLNEIVVSCNCAAGQPLCNKEPSDKGFKNMLRFSEHTMFPVLDPETQQERTELDLVQFVTEQYRPRNFHSEFESFAT